MQVLFEGRVRRRAAPRFMAAVVATLLIAGCSGDDGAGTEGPPSTQGPPGPEGPIGEQDEPSISSVSPAWLWLSRSEAVVVSGYDTAWSDGATVDFGEGVTVSDVVVASPTAIVAHVTIDAGAAPGPRDVVVTADDGELTAAGGFAVRPGLQIEHVAGDGTQGSINLYAIDLEDPGHDLAGGLFTTPGELFAHTIDGIVQGVHPEFTFTESVTYESGWALVEAVIDVNAPAEGPLNLVTTSFGGASITSTGVVTATPRTPVPLTLDVVADVPYGNVAYTTHLFEYHNDSATDQILEMGVTAGDGGEPMSMFFASASGHASDSHVVPAAGARVWARAGESVYMMASSPSSDTGFDFMAGAGLARPAAIFAAQETDDDLCEDAQDTGITVSDEEGLVIENGVFDTPIPIDAPWGESDWYRFTFTETTSFDCVAYGNDDLVLVAIFPADNCEVGAVTGTADPGDYYLRVASAQLATLRGATRYSVVCTLAYPP
jgi:hypothetical protein